MAALGNVSQMLTEMILGKRLPTPTAPGVVEATVVSSTSSTVTVTIAVLDPDPTAPSVLYGPCPYTPVPGASPAAPPRGASCLVAFAGAGIEQPFVVGFLDWPTSVGFLSSLTAADSSVVVAGTATEPTIATATLDVIATEHPPAADWSNNGRRITALANGSGATDAAAFGQIPLADGTAADIQPIGTQAAGTASGFPHPDHVHAMTYAAGSLGADVTLPTSTTTTVLDTASLAVGTWLVLAHVSLSSAGVTDAQAVPIRLLSDTATASFAGVQSTQVDIGNNAGSSIDADAVIMCVVSITVAGTLKLQADNSGTTGTTKAKATTNIGGFPNATGYVALRIG